MDVKAHSVSVRKPGTGKNDTSAQKTWSYDLVYFMDSTQVAIYEETTNLIVDSVLDGYNGTIF